MSIWGIQGFPLEVTVVACYNLDDKEWISRQDPYVSVEYGNTKYRTKTCTDGGRNPAFQEKFIFTLVEGIRELSVVVWNSHTLSADEHLGTGRIQLHKVLSQGFDDSSWPIQSKTGRHSGEVRLTLHYSNPNQISGSKYASPPVNQVPPYPFHAAATRCSIPCYSCLLLPVAVHGGYPPARQPSAYYPTGASGVYPPLPGIYPPPPY
ncbi:hypothetical protein OIU78_011962 [Salix suchowensis]|nr:hypothetical protein OIU78_011962 [Salix suchowensis]